MFTVLKILLTSGLLISLVGTGKCQVQKQEDRQEFAKRVRNFSFELLYHTSKALDDHTVISPFQIWCIMTVIAQGADGRSYDQLKTALNLPKSSTHLLNGYRNLTQRVEASTSDRVALQTGSFIFIDKDLVLEPAFEDSAKNNFSTQVIGIDFKDAATSAAKVNSFISQITQERISEVLYPSDFEGAQMIISNAIDFKGMWTHPFNVSDTRRQPFYNDKGQQIGEVNMMYQRASLPFASVAKLKGYALELSYGQDKAYSMLIILPHAGVSLADMFVNFQAVDLSQIFQRIDEDSANFEGDELDVSIPRFKITTDVTLNKPLNDMGIFDIFYPDVANLSRASKKPLAVSKVTQKAVLEVTEEGTTASAVTSVVLPNRIEPTKVMANRPFVYLVIEKSTTTVLFGGIYSKPSLF